MKKNKLAEFLKSKSFYALLCVGALAIVVIAMVGLNQTSGNNKNQNLVDLNEPISDVADGENSNQEIGSVPDTNNSTSSTAANKDTGKSQTEVAQGNTDNQSKLNQAVTDGSLLEFEAENSNGAQSTEDTAKVDSQAANSTDDSAVANNQTAETTEKATDSEKAAKTEKQEDSKAVMKPETLHFKPDNGLTWPVNGNVLMNYSPERVVYFATLEQFKCNPAIIIDAKVGDDVHSAAKGIITSVKQEDETGLTVTASLGNGYSAVYGQLKDVTVEVGDTVKEGAVIGKVAEPSKYYTVEGSNVYFKVLKDETTINPLDLLNAE